jgi:6-phosphogluconolactonase/glucosamine-6-phosphate isomerase/deaminase
MKILYRSELEFKLLALNKIRSLIKSKLVKNIIIPGGHSLKRVTKSLIKSYQHNRKIKFVLSDERIVANKLFQNSQPYRKYFQKHLRANRIYVFNISALRKVSNIYSKLLADTAKSIAILGVGDDGHIAGIFENQCCYSRKLSFFRNMDQNGIERISIPISILSSLAYRYAYISNGKMNALNNKKSPIYLYNPNTVYSSSY